MSSCGAFVSEPERNHALPTAPFSRYPVCRVSSHSATTMRSRFRIASICLTYAQNGQIPEGRGRGGLMPLAAACDAELGRLAEAIQLLPVATAESANTFASSAFAKIAGLLRARPLTCAISHSTRWAGAAATGSATASFGPAAGHLRRISNSPRTTAAKRYPPSTARRNNSPAPSCSRAAAGNSTERPFPHPRR